MLKEIIDAVMHFIHGERSPESVAAALDKLAADHKTEKLDWRHSTDDLLKLIDKPSGFGARKKLAHEFDFQGEFTGTASENIWLHDKVMEALNHKDIALP